MSPNWTRDDGTSDFDQGAEPERKPHFKKKGIQAERLFNSMGALVTPTQILEMAERSAALNERERVIVRGQVTGQRSLRDLGTQFNIVPERVRQIVWRSLRRLGLSARPPMICSHCGVRWEQGCECQDGYAVPMEAQG